MSVRVWKIDRDTILERLSRWAYELGQNENILAVVLFGSLARGDHTAVSDADVLIVLRSSSYRFDERIPAFMPTSMGIGVEVFPYTLEEVKRALKDECGVVQVAIKEGLILFKREAVLENLNLQLKEEKGCLCTDEE